MFNEGLYLFSEISATFIVIIYNRVLNKLFRRSQKMSELFTIASTHERINLPFDQFKNSDVYYEIIMYQSEEMEEVYLLKGQNDDNSAYLLIGVSSSEGKLFGLNKDTALKALNQILNRLTFNYAKQVDNKEISIGEINDAIQSLEHIPDSLLNKHDKFIKLTDSFYVLLKMDEERKTKAKMYIQVSEENYILPERLNFVGYSGSDDYGEIVLNNIFEKNLKSFHLINELSIFIDIGGGKRQQYVGLVVLVRKESDSSAILHFTTNAYNLKKSRMGVLISENIDPIYLIDFMIRSNGWEANFEGMEKYNQPFIVIIPIYNLEIETESIGLGNVEFFSSSSNNYDVLMMKEKLNEKWQGQTIAKVNVDSDSFYDTYSQAKRQIEDALNAINHIVKNDSLFELYSTENTISEWKRDFFVPKPRISSLVYMRNIVTDGIIVSDMERIVEPNTLKLGESFNEKVDFLEWYEDLIAANMDDSISKEMKSLLSALKWLKRSWDSSNIEDQIIFSNIAVEFLLSGETAPPLLNKDLNNQIVEAALKEFDSIFDGSDNEKNKLTNDIKQKFSGAMTNPPLFAKLNHLIDTLEIPIKKDDKDVLSLIRRKRNHLVHGRATEGIEMMDIWKANTIIGMIIAFKMKHKGGN